MPYQYEIFLSYPRLPLVVKWLDRFFEPLFKQWLLQELLARRYAPSVGQLNIFRDDREIGAGERWPRALREAARDSRCALAIMLPSYFASAYCRAEWETFRLRGKEFRRDLLVPVRFHDCHHLPLEEQVFDLSKYTAMVEDTPRWVEFHDQVLRLAGQTAERIVHAPEYPADPESRSWIVFDIPEPLPTPHFMLGRL